MCYIFKSICDLSRNIQGESDTISSFKNSFFQNLPSSKISSVESQTLSDVAQPTIDVKDSLIPMMPDDEKISPEKSFLTDLKINHPLIVEKLGSLPAPVNHYAVDRIFQENNLRRPISGHWTDAWNTPTIPVPSTTLDFDQDYDESRNYLSSNQFNEKNIDTVNISPSESCGNSCGELADYSYNFSETQTAKPWSVVQDEKFKKPEKQDKENYYDEVEDERNGHIAFSPYSRLKKLQNTFIDIIPKKPCDLCDISYIQKKESLEQENEISFAGKSNFQGTDVMKSKSKLHIADNTDNNNFKQVNKSNNSNLRINFLSTGKNQKAQNLKKPQFQGHYKVIGPLKKIIFRPLNRNLLRTNSVTKESKDLDQLNIPPFSPLNLAKKLGDETKKFLVKSFKLMRMEAPKNNITDAVLSTPVQINKTSLEDGVIKSLTDSTGIHNLTLKSFVKLRNTLDHVAHKSLKLQRKMVNNTLKEATSDLQFSNIRRKPRRREFTDRFLPHIQKPKIEDTSDEFRNTLVFELQSDIWSNISNRSRKSSRKEKLKLKKLSKVLITPIPIQNIMLNRFIQQRILVKKN
ncbi:unnamed protein product [Onchocerca flexuosa]|uniref:Uncharacterized protein n=1 Tax=Onchocerca flexuosa TaxID=387005 RepID=A0A183HY74_9BILA|nr:unnamed protein product [Onchocerca flexuosa]